MPRPRSHARLLALALGVLGGLLAFELALQVVAWVAWSQARGAAPDRPDAEHVVLCVGDSFTYGFGAATPDEAYPAVVERDARARGADLAVVNRGWAGQTSRDVLQWLPDQLARYRPDLVYILVGANDLWQRPARLATEELGDAQESFRIRWRTGRFLLLVGAWLAPGEDEPALPLLGTWHDGGVVLHFNPDGTLWWAGRNLTWWQEGDQLLVETEDGWLRRVEWRLTEERHLRFRLSNWHDWLELSPGLPPQGVAGDTPAALASIAARDGTPRPAGTGDVDGVVPTLGHHLGEMVRLCREAGARPVLMNYPDRAFAKPAAQLALRAAAGVGGGEGVDFLDHAAAFATLRASCSGEEYDAHFVADEHCSSRGYAVMAGLVTGHVLGRTR